MPTFQLHRPRIGVLPDGAWSWYRVSYTRSGNRFAGFRYRPVVRDDRDKIVWCALKEWHVRPDQTPIASRDAAMAMRKQRVRFERAQATGAGA